jgi:hypothetical protein
MSGMSAISTTKKHSRGAAVIMGPPGLFLALTLAALIAGVCISQSTTAVAVVVPHPAPTATSTR